MISSVRQYQMLGHKKLCSLRDNYSFSYVFARWIKSCNLDENWRNTTGVDGAVAAIFLKSSQDIFQEYKAELRQLVTELHLKNFLEQMYTMPSLVVLFEQECKQSC